MKRREFLAKLGVGGLLFVGGGFPYKAFAAGDKDFMLDANGDFEKLVILHTNDVHSRIEPFPDDGGAYANLGGAERRSVLINSIRKKEKNIILLDAGDMWQGTPYFNMFNGEAEYKVMNQMGYDVATLGNHDFDAGLDGLKKQLPGAKFQIVSGNYDFSDTVLHDSFKPYTILEKSGMKIGILGVGIELDGLVGKDFYGNTRYLDPVAQANKYARILKDKKCDLIICLSHLGYKYDNNKVSDVYLAENTENIDIIIGGHTHTFMDEPDVRLNKSGSQVFINQVGWAGLVLGRIEVYFEKNTKEKCVRCRKYWV